MDRKHLVALKAGRYRFSGTQTLARAGIGTDGTFAIALPAFVVKVGGERFTLNPAEINSVFPPNGSLGHYDNVLPHVILRRDTLPRERMIATSADEATEKRLEKVRWLALLAHARRSQIRLTGMKQGQVITVVDANGVLIHQETAAEDDCRVDCGLLDAGTYTLSVDGVAIEGQPLRVRPGDQVGGEAALVANRPPRSGAKSVVHLVSLEGCYTPGGEEFVFDFGGAGDAVPLVSLYSWSFTVLTEKETFRHYVGESGAVYNAAGRQIAPGNGRIPNDRDGAAALIPNHRLHQASAVYGDVPSRQLWIRDDSRQYFVSEDPLTKRFLVTLLPGDATPGLYLPDCEGDGPAIEKANHFLKQGDVPLPHHFRRGGRSVSWYRGPLLAGKPGKQIPADQFPVHTADELLRYDSTYGLFDTSYAAAWELGAAALPAKQAHLPGPLSLEADAQPRPQGDGTTAPAPASTLPGQRRPRYRPAGRGQSMVERCQPAEDDPVQLPGAR